MSFDETIFPYQTSQTKQSPSYDFLDSEPSPMFRQILQGPSPTTAVPPPLPEPPTQPAPAALEAPRHPMATRSKSGIVKAKQILSLSAQTLNPSPLPKSHLQALKDKYWNPSMTTEYGAIIKSGTYDLVPRPPGANVIRSMWLHKHKYDANGVFKKHKSRLVANGKNQQQGVDFDETFSPVVKQATIRTILNVALANEWPIHQPDVQNAFLHGKLDETDYIFQPLGFVDETKPNYVCKLNRSIYGLKQAPRAWNGRFVAFITKQGFKQSKSDNSLFVYNNHGRFAYVILYVDDIIVTASTPQLRDTIIKVLSSEFPMSDCGVISSFLGISAKFNDRGLFLNQTRYAEEIIE